MGEDVLGEIPEVATEASREAPCLAIGRVDAIARFQEAPPGGQRRYAVVSSGASGGIQARTDLGGLGGVQLPE